MTKYLRVRETEIQNGYKKKETHRQLKSYSPCKIFEFFQIQFYGQVVGIVVLPMP